LGTGGSLAQGVQQPFEISVVLDLDEFKGVNISIAAYPNPTTDHVTLQVNEAFLLRTPALSFTFYDMKGRILQSKKIACAQTSIDMVNLAPSTYFIRVTQQDKEVKIFKLIKN
jgi:hypothetical protein